MVEKISLIPQPRMPGLSIDDDMIPTCRAEFLLDMEDTME